MSRAVNPEECNHPIGERELQGIRREGEETRVEVCTKCGAELLGAIESLDRLRERQDVEETWRPETLILALLGALSQRPIHGKATLIKEAFLLEREVLPELGLGAPDLEFYPHKYGPTSDDLYDALEDLEDEGLVRTSKKEIDGDDADDEDEDREDIELTEEGRQVAENILNQLASEDERLLRTKRLGWDQLGLRALLLYVYRSYPGFADKTEIREYLGLDTEEE